MRIGRYSRGPVAVTMLSLAVVLLALPGQTRPVTAEGAGGATWTPSQTETTASPGTFLVEGDAVVFRTEASWDRAQAKGLAGYVGGGLRYTHEVNDRTGRLSATGYWATNHPDPAYDRDDDDGDRRWEETEIIAGGEAPEPGRTYTTLIEYSRWHPKRVKGKCVWAWDRRRGTAEVLSQLSRNLLGEWQAERYTLAYDSLAYGRVGARPRLPAATARARCRDADPGANQAGYVVTFARPLAWWEVRDLVSVGAAKWTAFEAIGAAAEDDRVWTCGGPFDDTLKLTPCRTLDVEIEGVTAVVGYLDEHALGQLRVHRAVAAVDGLRDSLTGLLYDIGGFGVERPGLTVDDRYWELVLTD
jgi:hypothetical protein